MMNSSCATSDMYSIDDSFWSTLLHRVGQADSAAPPIQESIPIVQGGGDCIHSLVKQLISYMSIVEQGADRPMIKYTAGTFVPKLTNSHRLKLRTNSKKHTDWTQPPNLDRFLWGFVSNQWILLITHVFCVSSSQGWSVCLRRSIWLLRYPNIWLNYTTTAPLTVTTHMWSTNAQQNTLSTEDLAAHLAPVLPDLTTRIFTIIISSSIITMTTSMESCRGNTSADAASNVCKGTLYSLHFIW